ncbi:MAG: SoxR reducing system RseC family protein [Ignavibacteriaceae bacterium]
MSEKIFETGTVISKKDELLEIALLGSENCKECAANIYCKPLDNDTKTVTVKDTLGCKVGDTVQFAIEGKNLLSASLKIYGFPLVLLVGVVIIFNAILEGNPKKEFYSILIALISMVIYYFIFFLTSKNKGTNEADIPITTSILINKND